MGGIICEVGTSKRSETPIDVGRKSGDLIDMAKFNALPSPVTARLCGGGEYWIETLCVQTGCMRLDVSGQIDLSHFAEVMVLIDIDGEEYEPDDFWFD